MEKLPPDNSVVVIKSCRFNTYLTSCDDEESVKLTKAEDPNKFPPNCLWTLQTKLTLGSLVGSIRFISPYGMYLATKEINQRKICQDYPTNSYSRFVWASWTYNRVGTVLGCPVYRLIAATSKWFMRAHGNGELDLDYRYFIAPTAPEFYWSIHAVKLPQVQKRAIPSLPFNASSDTPDVEKPKQTNTSTNIIHPTPSHEDLKFPMPVVINNNISPMAINSGWNQNTGPGNQQNGGIEVVNTRNSNS